MHGKQCAQAAGQICEGACAPPKQAAAVVDASISSAGEARVHMGVKVDWVLL